MLHKIYTYIPVFIFFTYILLLVTHKQSLHMRNNNLLEPILKLLTLHAWLMALY